MDEKIAIVQGVRTPFCKSGGNFRNINVDDLGAHVVREVLAKTGITGDMVDDVVIGNVLEPPYATNVGRVIAVKGGIPNSVPACTINRNCASGMEAVVSGAQRILLKDADIVVVGGAESMTHFPILFPESMRDLLYAFKKARTTGQNLRTLLQWRPSMMKPDVPPIGDPLCGLSMGQTAEVLSREFKVTREEQDIYSLLSQERAAAANREGRFAEEIVPIPEALIMQDDGVRDGQTLEDLRKLKPVFEKITGTVTAGNSSQVTDGACALILMRESRAKALGLSPLGYLREYAYAALEPERMGLGPAYATAKVLKKAKMHLKEIDLIEINEAFAAQIVACERAFPSEKFQLGELDREKLNVNGGAIALGHPIGASGARLILTLLLELRRRGKNLGLATLCVGGGQGEAVILEVAP